MANFFRCLISKIKIAVERAYVKPLVAGEMFFIPGLIIFLILMMINNFTHGVKLISNYTAYSIFFLMITIFVFIILFSTAVISGVITSIAERQKDEKRKRENQSALAWAEDFHLSDVSEIWMEIFGSSNEFPKILKPDNIAKRRYLLSTVKKQLTLEQAREYLSLLKMKNTEAEWSAIIRTTFCSIGFLSFIFSFVHPIQRFIYEYIKGGKQDGVLEATFVSSYFTYGLLILIAIGILEFVGASIKNNRCYHVLIELLEERVSEP